ncbi:MAG TPA: aspartate kinase [Bryobacteraceae bacterium]|nr:aspartate kinase [Bryobacteraceae bacterium]
MTRDLFAYVRAANSMTTLLVMKFGGTSMGSAERIKIAGQICTAQKEQRPVVAVVSAMAGVTDMLLNTLRHAEAGDEAGIEANLEKLTTRHVEAASELLEGERRAKAIDGVQSLIADFRRIAHGMRMLGERPPRSVDEGIAIGERLSAMLLAEHMESAGVAAEAVNGSDVIVTDAVFGNATPIMDETRKKVDGVLRPMLAAGVLPIVTGFNGATMDGRPTTLGRGGSDFSASILAAALDASELWIWTDVDGIMSADPRSVPDARVLEALTYSEAAELAYNGAKVLHPRTLAPLSERQIPVWSKNSFNLQHPGTRIVSKVEAPPGPRAVTSMKSVALISIEPASSAVSSTRLMARALEALADANAEVLALTSSSYRQSFCFLVRKEELGAAMESLESDLALELRHGYIKDIVVDENVGLLAVVGEGMHGTAGLAGRIFSAISEQNVNIIAIAQGSSELTISIVVHRDGLERAIQAVHKECR